MLFHPWAFAGGYTLCMHGKAGLILCHSIRCLLLYMRTECLSRSEPSGHVSLDYQYIFTWVVQTEVPGFLRIGGAT